MPDELRNSGIDIIGAVPWGTHFCQFYQSREDLVDILVPYFKAGLENNEACMWITAEPLGVKRAITAMARAMPDIGQYLAKGQIEIMPHTDWYLKGGRFESQRVLNGWVEKLEQALAKGYAGLRLTGNTFWLEKDDWQSFTDYEEAVNSVIGKYRMVALCTYCLDKCGAAEIVDVVRNHEFAIIKEKGKWDLFENSAYKATKGALIESEGKLRQLFQSMREGVCLHELICDDSGKAVDYAIIDVNPAYEAITGLRREQVAGKTASEAYGTGKPPYLDVYERVANSGKSESFETYFPPMQKHFSISAFSPGKRRFATVFTDITERKLVEEALKEGQRDLNRAQAVARTGSWRLDIRRNELLWSDETYRLFGIPKGTPMTYETFLAGVHPEDRQHVEEKWAAALRGEEYDIEHRIVVANEVRWVRERAELEFEQGVLKGGFGTVQDVTQRRKTEEALRESEAELSTILSSVPLLILTMDPERRVLKANAAAAEFAGRGVQEMAGLRGGEALRCLHSFDDPRGCGFGHSCQSCKVRHSVLSTFETGDNHYEVECHLPFMRGGEQEEVTFLLSTVLLNIPRRQVLVCIEDISARKKAEEEILRLNERLQGRAAELEAANRELESFSYSVSHDLRAPLRSMDGFSQALLEDYSDKLDEQGRDYLARIQNSAQLMAQLIDDILELARITRTEMRLEDVNLSDLAHSIASELRKAEPERHVDVAVSPGLVARGDAKLLRVVLVNLLNNAWKFTSKVPRPRIEFGVMQRDDKKAYFVRDNGAGFDMAHADKLFNPFQRLHSAAEFPGSGVGLASAQRIIQRHGGEVWAEGKVARGATFYFTLP